MSKHYDEGIANDPVLARLAAANPQPEVPDSLADFPADYRDRAEDNLDKILDGNQGNREKKTSRRPWMAAAAGVGILALSGALLPQLMGDNAPEASAREVLNETAVAAGQQPDAIDTGITNLDYFKRVDTDGQATVTTEYQTSGGGEVDVDSQSTGNLQGALAQLAENPLPTISTDQLLDAGADRENLIRLARDNYDSVAVGALHLLLHPALSSDQQKALYEVLAEVDGNQLAGVNQSPTGGEDDVVTVIRDQDKLSFSVIPATGQLVRVSGLLGQDITTTVDATAILGCVNVTGLEGPDDIYLTCADGNYYVDKLEWDNWGKEKATARGRAVINNCDPYCAEGTFEEFPVRITVDELTECGYNARVYSRLYVEFDEANSERNEYFNIGCTADEPIE